MAQDLKTGIPIVFTKPPESVMVFVGHKQGGGLQYLVFDSHGRPGLDGAHILSFPTRKDLTHYIMNLFYVDPSVRGDYMYTIFDGIFLCSNDVNPVYRNGRWQRG